jgi:tetratricopeptide (TPR) repeat protein
MPSALLVQYFIELPSPREGEDFSEWRARHFKATKRFKKLVLARYTEGTLIRLLDNKFPEARKASLFALGLLGTMEANPIMARLLHDGDSDVADMATASLWNLWFRADSEENNTALQKATRVRDREKALESMTVLIGKAPEFAEALNQRAIVYFRMKQYEDSIADCQKVLDLNPWHFGALVGMAQGLGGKAALLNAVPPAIKKDLEETGLRTLMGISQETFEKKLEAKLRQILGMTSSLASPS